MENVVVKVNATENLVKEFTPADVMPVTWESWTADKLAYSEELSLPLYQRSAVWSEKQVQGLRDTLIKGYPVPPIIIGRIVKDDKVLLLLVDGCQRRTAIRSMLDVDPGEDAFLSDELDYISEREIPVMVVHAPSVEALADLFGRYNSGSPLSAIQRNKANLPADVLEMVKPWTDYAADNLPRKCGSVSYDSAALMLAAGMVSEPQKLTSSGATACKALAKDGVKIPAVPAILSDIIKTANALPAGDYGATYWFSPSRLVPMLRAATDTNATTEKIASVMRGWAVLQGTMIPGCPAGKGKKKGTTSRSVSAIFGDTSSGPKATYQRYLGFKRLFAGKQDTAELDANIAAIKAALEGGEG